MIEKINSAGYRVGNIDLVDPMPNIECGDFIQSFIARNNYHALQAIMYDQNGKIIATHSTLDDT